MSPSGVWMQGIHSPFFNQSLQSLGHQGREEEESHPQYGREGFKMAMSKKRGAMESYTIGACMYLPRCCTLYCDSTYSTLFDFTLCPVYDLPKCFRALYVSYTRLIEHDQTLQRDRHLTCNFMADLR